MAYIEFNGTPVTNWTRTGTTTVTTTVPAGATTGPIIIKTAGGIAVSDDLFIVT